MITRVLPESGRRGLCWGNIIWLWFVWAAVPGYSAPPETVTGERGMVVSVSPPASEVGAEILRAGGNAVDAAVAVAFALEVTWPEAGNIGGGGFMMVSPADGGPCVCVEYREKAPAAATQTMFQLDETKLSQKAVGVPGTVRGLALAHEKYGKLKWSQLVAPAVRLAREGFVVDQALANSMNRYLQMGSSKPFSEFLRVYGKPDGSPWVPGERLVQPDLAVTLTHIAERGAAGFYEGPVAEKLVAEMQSGNGLITLEDLANYEARIRKPVQGTFLEYEVYASPPPSAGGTSLIQMLNILEYMELDRQAGWSADNVHLSIEAMRRAFLDRSRHIGDPDFVEIPESLLTKEHAAELASTISRDRASSSVALADDLEIVTEAESTTHFSILDADGMAVSNTYTLEASFGSRVVVRGAGFLLNNEMGDFNWKPGHTDLTGNLGTPPNVIAPGKRMLSSQTPVIVRKDGRAYLITGSPGGRTIPNTVLEVTVGVLAFEMPLADAVHHPRWHHQWLPDRVRLERNRREEQAALAENLEQRGHEVYWLSQQGDAHSIRVNPETGKAEGVADRRRGGSAVAE